MTQSFPKKPTPSFLTQKELADRWRISPKSLERWRWEGKDPPYTKLHGKVLYARDDILDFEARSRRSNTSDYFNEVDIDNIDQGVI